MKNNTLQRLKPRAGSEILKIVMQPVHPSGLALGQNKDRKVHLPPSNSTEKSKIHSRKEACHWRWVQVKIKPKSLQKEDNSVNVTVSSLLSCSELALFTKPISNRNFPKLAYIFHSRILNGTKSIWERNNKCHLFWWMLPKFMCSQFKRKRKMKSRIQDNNPLA